VARDQLSNSGTIECDDAETALFLTEVDSAFCLWQQNACHLPLEREGK
jgi:hypothetical protein